MTCGVAGGRKLAVIPRAAAQARRVEGYFVDDATEAAVTRIAGNDLKPLHVMFKCAIADMLPTPREY